MAQQLLLPDGIWQKQRLKALLQLVIAIGAHRVCPQGPLHIRIADPHRHLAVSLRRTQYVGVAESLGQVLGQGLQGRVVPAQLDFLNQRRAACQVAQVRPAHHPDGQALYCTLPAEGHLPPGVALPLAVQVGLAALLHQGGGEGQNVLLEDAERHQRPHRQAQRIHQLIPS